MKEMEWFGSKYARATARLALAMSVCLLGVTSVSAQTGESYCQTKIQQVVWNAYGSVSIVTGLGAFFVCNIDTSLPVDDNGNNSISAAQCQYLTTMLMNAKNAQSNVTFDIKSTATHTAPACAANMYNWVVPDPYPQVIYFF
jgi:hypothetical protein